MTLRNKVHAGLYLYKTLLATIMAAPLMACTPTQSTASKFDASTMDDFLSNAVTSGEVIGVSALIFKSGQSVYKGAFGLRDREQNKPVELDTVWRIYSMTKPITSAVIMDLQDEGKLSLSDPVIQYIPELVDMLVAQKGEDGKPVMAPQKQPMTLEDLMLHRAGLAYGIFGDVNPVETLYAKAGLFDPSETLETKMTKLSKLPLITQPGQAWYYSYSIDVLGRIAEIVTRQRFTDILKERIFAPLGMDETGFYVKPNQKARFATNYIQRKNGTYKKIENQPALNSDSFLTENAFQSGGGGLISTQDDYAKFAQMMLSGGVYNGERILKKTTVQTMMSDQMGDNPTFLFPWLGEDTHKSFGYGGSIVIKETPEHIARTGEGLDQWGWSGAARTTFWIDPPNDSFGILMLQFFSEEDPTIHQNFRALAYDLITNE